MHQSSPPTVADAIELLERIRPRWTGESPSRWRDTVYCLLHEGIVVYVGYSGSVANRIRAHRAKREVDGWIAYTFPCRQEALSAERTMIAALQPVQNVLGR